MTFALISSVTFIAVFSLLLFVVNRLRPTRFKLKATVTKWISLDVEIQSPQHLPSPPELQHDQADNN